MGQIQSPDRSSPQPEADSRRTPPSDADSRRLLSSEADSRRALIEALTGPRYEILPLEGVADEVLELLPSEVKLTVTASPSKGLDATLDLAERLSGAGYAVTPHVSARLVRDGRHLEDLVHRLRAARVTDLFVIAGDMSEPCGEFEDAAALLSAMGGLRERFADVGISGYPESHHAISDEMTIKAMFEKEPMATYIVSQICFEADVISTWVRRVRDRGTFLPIWIGVPGTVGNRKLFRISRRIGLGESARFLRAHGGWIRRLVLPRVYKPTSLIGELAPTVADPASRIGGFHIYTFNELERTESWRRQLVEQLLAQENPE